MITIMTILTMRSRLLPMRITSTSIEAGVHFEGRLP